MLEDPIVKDQFLIGSDTVFDFGHRIFSPSDISCYVYNPDTKTETELTSGTDFSVGMKPGTTDYSSGARITMLTTQPAAGKLTVVRTVLPKQDVSLPNFGKIPSESLEAQLDRTIAVVQQLHDTVQLTYKIPYGQSGTVSPEQSIKNMISSGGGGSSGGSGGGGGGSSYEFSNEFNVTSGGSVSVNKIDKSKIDGLSSSLEEKQDKLVSGGSYNIKVHSAAVAGGFVYDGPFALNTYGSGSAMTAGIKSGYVYAGGSQYLISAFDNDSVLFGEGSTLYLTLLSSGGAITSGLVTSPSGATSDTVVVRIASRGLDSEKTEQIQFGDIVTVPWGLGGGAANVGIVSKTWNTSHTAEADGLIMANAVMTPGTAVGGAGSYAAVTVGTTTYKFAETPQSGINTGSYGCSIQVPVTSGQIWSATSLNNTSDCKLYFLKFTSSGN